MYSLLVIFRFRCNSYNYDLMDQEIIMWYSVKQPMCLVEIRMFWTYKNHLSILIKNYVFLFYPQINYANDVPTNYNYSCYCRTRTCNTLSVQSISIFLINDNELHANYFPKEKLSKPFSYLIGLLISFIFTFTPSM